MGVGGQRHAPPDLPPGKTLYPLDRRMGGPQGRSGQIRKICERQQYQTIIFCFVFQVVIAVQSRGKLTPMQEVKIRHRDTNKSHVAAKHLVVQAWHAVCNGWMLTWHCTTALRSSRLGFIHLLPLDCSKGLQNPDICEEPLCLKLDFGGTPVKKCVLGCKKWSKIY